MFLKEEEKLCHTQEEAEVTVEVATVAHILAGEVPDHVYQTLILTDQTVMFII